MCCPVRQGVGVDARRLGRSGWGAAVEQERWIRCDYMDLDARPKKGDVVRVADPGEKQDGLVSTISYVISGGCIRVDGVSDYLQW